MNRIQDQAAKMTQTAIEALLRTARHVPEDKRDWQPMGAARSALNQMAECVQFAEYLCEWLTADYMPTSVDREKMMAIRQEFVERCKDQQWFEETARARYNELVEVIRSTADSRLDQEFLLPVGGRTVTGADMLFLGYWNLTYHLGQINYIQLMLGDTEMH
ncbi:MAG TPA: DinB family protein [Armatimonadota bacterium]|nr:DinB family protein [Armatimonadota bacterium]